MGIIHINGFELNAGLSVYTANGANAAASVHDRAWVAYTTTQDPGAQNVNLLVNISTNDTEAGEVSGAIPPGGGKCALALTAPNNSHIEFLSPPNLLDGEQSAPEPNSFHGTGGKGLKRMGFRFFYRTPEAFEVGTDQLCRFYDGDLERKFSDAGGSKIEEGSPLFRLSFKADQNDASKAGLFVKTHDNSPLGETGASCFNVSAAGTPSWHQIAITVVVGAAPGENPQDSDGLLIINVDGVDVVTINAAIQFPNIGGGNPPANAIEYYSLLTSNTDAFIGSPIRTLFDNIVVYDHWQPAPDPNNATFSDLQGTIGATKALNQVIQGVFPVNESGGEGGLNNTNIWGNWEASDGSAALASDTSHLAIQGDADNTTDSAPEDPIAYAGGSYLKTDDIGETSKYSVETWGRGMVDNAWDSKIDEVRAVRVINVCKFTAASNEKVQLTFKAPSVVGAPATGGTSIDKNLVGNDFQIVSAVFDHNPDGNVDENTNATSPGPLTPNGDPADKSYVIDSMSIGLKVNPAGGGG